MREGRGLPRPHLDQMRVKVGGAVGKGEKGSKGRGVAMPNMPNHEPKCEGCQYNTPKTRGGQGKICNGYTMTEEGRCPQWRISEIRESMRRVSAFLKK